MRVCPSDSIASRWSSSALSPLSPSARDRAPVPTAHAVPLAAVRSERRSAASRAVSSRPLRALVESGERAEKLHLEAIESLGQTRMVAHLARARLSYGEWLRREKRRADAREQLRQAHEAFASMGAEGFADRARRELLATGERVRKRRDETRDDLTPQEEHIARLACDGHTNPQIGEELYLSSRTVEWHLHKVFAKLGIDSRRGLRGALAARDARRASA